ncbi:hypothetical protein QQS21_006704 [Conoideocrella luteorostrata]|uniref:Major facilitator superfamily (MFS) profile domain-containing protein n=1 Tax=Conoideocrella luteorostrata TaxID=1105319 RepID=A0AAJ0CMY6_9HYPO|nr:hypothetical protein QQS21_006704 [Conoideocrella luteorostrata]
MDAWATLTREGKRPVLLEFRSSTKLIMLMVSTAVFTDIFPYAVIVPLLPFVLTDQAEVSHDEVQLWTSVSLAAFGAAILISAPIWGLLADRTNDRRTPMLSGLLLLAAATCLLCFMKNVAMLILGRIFQGMTSALTWSVGMALVVDTVSTERIGQAMGWIGTALSLGTLTSPLLGGIVYGKGGYYEVWVMCFAIIAGDIVLRLLVIEKKHAAKWLKRTYTSVSQITQATDNTDMTDITEEVVIPTICQQDGTTKKGTGTQAPSYHDESRAAKTPQRLSLSEILGLFKSPRLLAALWGTVVEAVVLSAFDGTLPIFVEGLFGWDSIGTGLIFLPLVLPTCLGPLVGHLCDRYGLRWLSAIGFALYTPFLICLRFVSENSLSHKIILCGLLAGVGVGVAFTFGPVTAEITYAVEERFQGRGAKPIALAYALYNIAFSLGTMTGPLLGGFIRENAGWPTVVWSLAVISATTAILCAIFIGGPPLWKCRSRNLQP